MCVCMQVYIAVFSCIYCCLVINTRNFLLACFIHCVVVVYWCGSLLFWMLSLGFNFECLSYWESQYIRRICIQIYSSKEACFEVYSILKNICFLLHTACIDRLYVLFSNLFEYSGRSLHCVHTHRFPEET